MRRIIPSICFIPLVLAAGRAQDTASALRVAIQLHRGPAEVHEWKGDVWLEKTLEQVSEVGGGTLTFSAGVFEFHRGIRVKNVKDVHFRGSPGTVFRLREMPEFGRITITASSPLDGNVFEVDRPDLIEPHGYYQVFRADLEGNRILELEARAVEGSKVAIEWHTNAQITAFEPGMRVFPALNFFHGWACGDLSFRDITFDGNCDVDATKVAGMLFWGHTMHCGVLLMNRYTSRPDDPAPRPATVNLDVQNCVFRRLLGRGVTAYNMRGIRVVNCRFEDMGAEGVEIDHLSQDAIISGCILRNVKLGMRLNDCNDVTVSNCLFTDCITGIHVTDAMHQDDLNKRLVIHGNVFHGGNRAIGLGDNAGDMVIAANVISESRSIGIELRGGRNTCFGNTIVGCRGVGIRAVGSGHRIESNLIEPASPAPSGFVAIDRVDR